MRNFGYFKVRFSNDPRREQRMFGELFERRIKGVDGFVKLAVFRKSEKGFGFACAHFPTGWVVAVAPTMDGAIGACVRALENDGGLKELDKLPVINTELEQIHRDQEDV